MCDLAENIILKERRDLAIIGYDKPIIIFDKDGLKLDVSNQWGELVIHLELDNIDVMSTKIGEHLSIIEDIKQCPQDARVLVAGLGFGLNLLYLAESKKTKEVIVCEIDQRVLDKFSVPIADYLHKNYPDFNFIIVKGDVYEEITKHGLFDWVYIDLINGVDQKFYGLANSVLTRNGKQTHFKDVTLDSSSKEQTYGKFIY